MCKLPNTKVDCIIQGNIHVHSCHNVGKTLTLLTMKFHGTLTKIANSGQLEIQLDSVG